MALEELCHPSRDITRSANGLARGSGAFSCVAHGITGSLHRGVFLADGALLLPAGQRVAGELRILRSLFGLQIPNVGFIQRTFSLLRLLIGTQLVRMIGMFAHLQGGGIEPVALQPRAYRSIVILIGLRKLLVQLLMRRFYRTVNRMPETGGRLCLGFLKTETEFLFPGMGRRSIARLCCSCRRTRGNGHFPGGVCASGRASTLCCLFLLLGRLRGW